MDLRRRGIVVASATVTMCLVLIVSSSIAVGDGILGQSTNNFAEVQPPEPDRAGRPPINWPGQRPVFGTSESGSDELPGGERPAALGAHYANCRFGVGVVRNPIDVYTDLEALRVGWYVNWSTHPYPLTPHGIEFYQTIRLSQPKDAYGNYLPTFDVTPPLTKEGLGSLIDAFPGVVWTVGNEPDIWSQDGITPDIYAKAYHRVYEFIKTRDPSALVAIAPVVQPSPVRLLYLDTILDHYADLYGTAMPVDVWTIHIYSLREVAGEWGAQLPPGVDSGLGIDYPVESHGNVTVFADFVNTFRAWMAARGHQNKPLLVSEMGVLMPEWWQPIFDETRVKQFMNGAFDYLLSATNPDTGYPADNYRLAQMWNWFSLDDDTVDATGALRWNGMLYNSATHQTTAFGDEFASYTGQILPTIDLVAADIVQQPRVAYSPTDPITVTLDAIITNAGNTQYADTFTVRFFDITDGSAVRIGNDQTITGLKGCAMERTTVSVEWPNVLPGAHKVRVVVDPADEVSEEVESNNAVTGVVLVATDLGFLPYTTRRQ